MPHTVATLSFKPRQHGLACLHALAFFCLDDSRRRQIDINPAAEADDSEAFAPAQSLALDKIAADTPRDQAGNLYHDEIAFVSPSFAPQADGHPLVVLACLIEGGIKKASTAVMERHDFSGHGSPIHMHVEDVHEDTQA